MTSGLRTGREVMRIVKAAELIRLDPGPEERDKAFIARDLVQVTLPHSNPGDVQVWGRKNGNLSLTIAPGWDIDPATGQPKSIGLPYQGPLEFRLRGDLPVGDDEPARVGPVRDVDAARLDQPEDLFDT